jgi:oligosaccharide repeat unit polymerase
MIYIPFFYFFILLFFNFLRTREFNLGNFLLLLYSFSALISIVLYKVEFLHYKDTKIELSSCLFYCGFLTLFFLPFIGQNKSKFYQVLLPNIKTFTIVSLFFIVINFIAILFLLKVIVFILTHDPGTLKRDGLKSIYAINSIEAIGQWILGHFSDFYVLLLVFFFYSRTYLKTKPSFSILLLLSSMTTIINGLFVGGRTQLIYWVLVFISCFLYFKDDMSKKDRRSVAKFSVIIFSLLSFYLITVTIIRFSNAFSDATEYAEVFSLLDYAGQSFLNFNDFYTNFHPKSYTIARIFPFTYDLFSEIRFDLDTYKRTLPIDIGVFSTFLGDFIVDIGKLGVVIYAIFYLMAAFITQKVAIYKSKKLQQILMLFLLFQIPLNGLFYYSLYNKTAMISVIGTIIIAILFKLTEDKTIEVHDRSGI